MGRPERRTQPAPLSADPLEAMTILKEGEAAPQLVPVLPADAPPAEGAALPADAPPAAAEPAPPAADVPPGPPPPAREEVVVHAPLPRERRYRIIATNPRGYFWRGQHHRLVVGDVFSEQTYEERQLREFREQGLEYEQIE